MLQFEQGVGLLRQCYQVLEAAEQRIEILTGADREGNPRTAPFDGSATFDSSTLTFVAAMTRSISAWSFSARTGLVT